MDSIEEAARRTAINLMRLNEALEMQEARGYSLEVEPSGQHSRKSSRMAQLHMFYKNWFNDVAGSTRKGYPDKGVIGSHRGDPAATREDT